MSKRRRGTGNIERRGESFSVRVRIDGRRRRLGAVASRAEAEQLAQASAEVLYEESAAGTVAVTFAQLGEKYLDARERSRTLRAPRQERSRWRTHVVGSHLGGLAVEDITSRDVREWIDELVRKDGTSAVRHGSRGTKRRRTKRRLSQLTIEHALTLVRVVLRHAVEQGLIGSNPAREIRVPRIVTTRETWTYLSAREVQLVLGCEAIPEASRAAFAVAIFVGLRQGEIWGLHWSDVILDGDHSEVVVRYSYSGPTKSGKPRRVHLLPEARAVLSAWKLVAPRSRLGLVFPHRLAVTAKTATTPDGRIASSAPARCEPVSSRSPASSGTCASTISGTRSRAIS